MKVLFVCRGNVGRSQMAAAFYNKLRSGAAASAGTIVDLPDQKLKHHQGANKVVLAMQEKSLDMSDESLTQLTPVMLDDFDKIIVMAEPYTIPDYLKNNPKYEYWEIEDAKGKTLESTRIIRDEVESRVKKLVVQI